jgi:2'-5' RNA ligase
MTLIHEPQSRLFFALTCSPALRKTISQWRASLSLQVGRPVPATNFHLALLFLGAVDKAQIAAICAAATKIKVSAKPLTLVLDRLETWRKSKALVIIPGDAPPALMRLSYALEQAMLKFGDDKEIKEFRPHLTFSRDYQSAASEACSPPEFFLRANRFGLYRSHKGQHTFIADLPLAQPADGSQTARVSSW